MKLFEKTVDYKIFKSLICILVISIKIILPLMYFKILPKWVYKSNPFFFLRQLLLVSW